MCELPILKLVWCAPSPQTPLPRYRPSRADVTVTRVCAFQYVGGRQWSSCELIQCQAPMTDGVADTANRSWTIARCESRTGRDSRTITGDPTPTTSWSPGLSSAVRCRWAFVAWNLTVLLTVPSDVPTTTVAK